jgi:hypothetical protein
VASGEPAYLPAGLDSPIVTETEDVDGWPRDVVPGSGRLVEPKEFRTAAPCPVCGLPAGFHDRDKHGEHHVPRQLLKAAGWHKEKP